MKNSVNQTLTQRKQIRSWSLYDWANSAYSLVISTAIFPIYYTETTKVEGGPSLVKWLGMEKENTVALDYTLAIAIFLAAVLSITLSGIADKRGSKKSFLYICSTLGALSCMGLFFFTSKESLNLGLGFSFLASLFFSLSLVFYNAFLPDIAHRSDFDKVSARGFIMGYIGSVLLMIFCLVMILKPDLFGFGGTAIASRTAFVLVGAWWLLFGWLAIRGLPASKPNPTTASRWQILGKVWQQVKSERSGITFLRSFFFYSLGVQTVILVAAAFATKALKMEQSFLIGTIMLIQLTAILGSYLFSRVASKRGNKKSISTMILIWIAATCTVLLIPTKANEADHLPDYLFFAVAAIVGLVMGGIQSVSRSTFAKLIPETEDETSYFSFLDVLEKSATILGLLAFGLMEEVFGIRASVYPLILSFIIGFLILRKLKDSRLLPNANLQGQTSEM